MTAASDRVLIVDDDRDSASSMSALIRAFGFETQTACSGAEALSCMTPSAPRCVLLDLAMPHMSGIELAKNIRARHGDAMTILAVTGFLDADYHQAAHDSGVDQVLTKPVDWEKLRAALAPVAGRG